MNKMIEPTIEPTMTEGEETYMVMRAQQGLADIAGGRTMTVDEARTRMVERAGTRRQAE